MASHGRLGGTSTVAGTLMVMALSGCLAGGVTGVATPEGIWVGSYATSESGGELTLRIQRDEDGWTVEARASSLYAGSPEAQRASSVTVDCDSVAFTLDWGSAVRFLGSLRGDTLSGDIDADHWTGSWVVTRGEPEGG